MRAFRNRGPEWRRQEYSRGFWRRQVALKIGFGVSRVRVSGLGFRV